MRPTLKLKLSPRAHTITQPLKPMTQQQPRVCKAPRYPEFDFSDHFPSAFNPRFSTLPRRPLAIGIHKMIKQRLPQLTNRRIEGMLSAYTSNPKYLAVLQANAPRYDLDGNQVGLVTEKQAEIARHQLAARSETDKAA